MAVEMDPAKLIEGQSPYLVLKVYRVRAEEDGPRTWLPVAELLNGGRDVDLSRPEGWMLSAVSAAVIGLRRLSDELQAALVVIEVDKSMKQLDLQERLKGLPPQVIPFPAPDGDPN